MNFFEPSSPHVLPLPCERSQLSRAPISITTSESLSTVERAAPAQSGCVSGRMPLAMLIGRNGIPAFSMSARIASSACAQADDGDFPADMSATPSVRVEELAGEPQSASSVVIYGLLETMQ